MEEVEMASDITLLNGYELKALTRLVRRPEINIEFCDLSYTIHQPTRSNWLGKDVILRSVSGTFRSGELSAIIGSSGAGKTSLMNILAGYVCTGVEGKILTNGLPREKKQFNKLSAYIMQDDISQPYLSVKEIMMIAAKLKLGNEQDDKEKEETVDEILYMLGLHNSRNTRTEKLSGGEAKRLAVALELVNNPPVMFLDEPTTGLDTVATKQLITLLKLLARQGRTIICTIHQPTASIYQQFDHVYVLGRGQCVYQGSHDQLVPFLSSVGLSCPTTYNPADFIIECVHGENLGNIQALTDKIMNGKLSKSYISKEKSSMKTEDMNDITSEVNNNIYVGKFATSFLTQFWILLKRMWLQRLRNVVSVSISAGYYILLGILIAVSFSNVGNDGNRVFQIFLFVGCILIFFLFTHGAISILNLPTSVRLLQREYFNRWYGLRSYYTALVLSTLPEHLIFGPVFLTIVYTQTDQPQELYRFLWFTLFCLSIGFISEAAGQAIGSIFSERHGVTIGSVVFALPCIFAYYGMGFGPYIHPVYRFVMSLSYYRMALTGACLGIFENRQPLPCDSHEILYCHYRNPALLIKDMGMEYHTKIGQLCGLVFVYVLCRTAAFLALRLRLNMDAYTRLQNFVINLFKLLKIDIS